MDWPLIIRILQWINGLVWIGALCVNTPALYRLWRGRGRVRLGDPYFSVAWFLALSQIGFIARWRIWPDQIGGMSIVQLQFWATCYLISGAAAAALVAYRGLLR